MTVSFQDVVFAFDFSRIETVGGVRYLWDYGPNQFSFAFPGGAADPTPQLDGSLYFNAAPQYLSLPAGQLARFYAVIPTTELTLLLSYRADAGAGALWSNWNSAGGGLNKGISVLAQVSAAVAPRFYQFQGGAPQPYLLGSIAHGLGRKNVLLYTMEAAPRGLTNNATNGAAWAVGAFGATVHDTAIVPRIGCYPAGVSGYTGAIYYLALLRGAASSQDLSSLSALLGQGVKPFCWRQT